MENLESVSKSQLILCTQIMHRQSSSPAVTHTDTLNESSHNMLHSYTDTHPDMCCIYMSICGLENSQMAAYVRILIHISGHYL